MTSAHWTSALADFLAVVVADLATLVRECPDNVWELSMWDVTKDSGWGRPQPLVLASGDPDPRGVEAHSAVWYVSFIWSTRLTGTSRRARSGRTHARSCWTTSRTSTRRRA